MKHLPDMQKRGSKLILFSVIAYPVLLVLFLHLVFPLICNKPDTYINYYILASVSLLSIFPFLLSAAVVSVSGDKLAEIFGSANDKHSSRVAVQPLRWSAIFAIISFCILLPVIYLTAAVPSEGWLRSIFAAAMLCLITPVVIVRLYLVERSSRNRLSLLIICLLMIIAVPLGLVLHHPLNYLLFISPLYWISWSWIISSPTESLLYGLIALALLSAIMIASLRSLRKIGQRV
jgi:hypothetical protein